MTHRAPRDQLVRIAWLYHEHHLTQREIADRLGVSRSTVSRALAEAEQAGIIDIRLTVELPEASRLAESLVQRFGITRAVVGVRLDDQDPMDAAAAPMSRLIEQLVARGPATIAAGWGRTLARSARQTRPRPTTGVRLIDAVGHASASGIAPAVDVTSTLAARFGAQVTHLHSPAFAANPDVAQALLSSSEIAATLEEARTAGAVLVSVGVVGSGSLLLTEGFLSHADMRGLVARGAVGEILGHYYDRDGRHVPTGALLPIGLTLDQLRENGHVVAVAAGVEKVEAVRAALAGGLVDKLAVDDAHAVTLLRQP